MCQTLINLFRESFFLFLFEISSWIKNSRSMSFCYDLDIHSFFIFFVKTKTSYFYTVLNIHQRTIQSTLRLVIELNSNQKFFNPVNSIRRRNKLSKASSRIKHTWPSSLLELELERDLLTLANSSNRINWLIVRFNSSNETNVTVSIQPERLKMSV